MQLFFILIVLVTGFLLIIKMIAGLTGRVSERLLTNYFRSAEALDNDELPPAWGDQIQKMARRGVVRTGPAQMLPWDQAAKPFLMKKIRGLRKYFETSPFVENQEAREAILELFDDVATRWEASELPDILAYYDVTIDTR